MTDRLEFDSSALQLLKETNVLYLSAAVCVFSIFLAGFVSIVVAVVVLFSFIAGLLVPYFAFKEGKHVPNLLVVFLGTDASEAGDDKRRELRRSCSVCGGEQCSRQLPASLASPIPGPHHPHVHITVPRCVDEALDELLTLVLDEHVYSWYREFSVHDQLADEVRYVIRYAVCVLQARLQEVDLPRVITERLLPSLFSHLDQYVEGGRRVRMAGGVETSVLEYTRRAGWLHPAMESRDAEAQFLRSLVTALEPFLLPQKYQGSSVTNSFLKELLGRFLLLQLMDYLADPDTVNLLLLLLLNPDYLQQQQHRHDSFNQVLMLQSLQPHKAPLQEHALKLSPDRELKEGGSSVCSAISRSERDLEPVLLLKNFSSVNTLPRNSSLRNNLSAVLKDQTLLYLFHTFLKEESAINILQFCLAVEDFNRHILDPELSGGELQQLHSEAQDLYHSYMAPGAPDKLPFPHTVVQQIRDMVHSEASAIVKLRTTRPLFQAYEFAYNLLEREYLPLFMNSHMYFAHLCGSRSSQVCQKTSSRHRRTDSSSSATFSPFKTRISRIQDESSSPRGGRRGLEGITSGSYRDLSAWRVTIPRLDYVPDPNTPSKMTHFFVIDVTRIDVTGDAEGSEEIHWEVLRRFHEFYILESKLTEFHGEFQYNTLPSRRSLFTPSHASDFMLTRRQIFEEYLQKLLQTPALRRSQLLFLFLKSKDEFTTSFLPDVSLGRLLRDVPRKLVKERGQHLEPFIELFLQSAGPAQPQLGRKKSENLEEATEACESLNGTEELYPLHTRLYGDNARSLSPPPSQCLPTPPPPAVFSGAGITEMIMYIGVRVYGVGLSVVRWLVALNSVVGSTIDAALTLLIRRKLAAVLTPLKIVKLIHLLRDALVEPGAERSGSARRRRELEFRAAVLGLLPPWFTRLLLDDDSYKEGANTLVNLFQHPLLNKQLSYVLLDQVLEEVFPELSDPADGGGEVRPDKRPCGDDTASQPVEQTSVSSAEEANI